MYKENLVLYDAIIDKCDRFARKGKTMPYTSANGHMFSRLNKSGEIGIRFSKQVQEKYLEHFNTRVFKSYNAVMKGYILLTDEMLQNEQLVMDLLNESFEYVMSLEPK